MRRARIRNARRPLRRLAALLAAGLAVAAAFAVSASAGTNPVSASGAPVELVASGLQTVTAFAWDAGTMFAGEGPSDPSGAPGGLFVVAGGGATKVPGSPANVYGLAWHNGKLYVSTGPAIVAMSRWNGTSFASIKTIWSTTAASFAGFNGIAFGPDGRLYAGLALKDGFDHVKDPYPLSQGVVSMTAAGKDLKIIARGIRQPFQLDFPTGARWPYVSDLGQDAGTIPPDEIVVAKPGSNFGFPTCTWRVAKGCSGFTKPKILLPAHASPMGIASAGHTLYVALFTGIGGNGFNPEVVTIPTDGGAPTPFVTDIGFQVIGLAIHRNVLYVGTVSGSVYSVALPRVSN
jgi:glucose/arabinose dehydrogenase